MTRLRFRLALVAAAIRAMVRVPIRRGRRGPTVPGWTWREEFFVATFRAVAFVGARNLELMSPVRRGRKLPIGRATAHALDVDDVDLDGVRAERFRPTAGPRGTIVYFHGGGFISGSVESERRPAAENAVAMRCEAFSVDYRLAPRHPYPAALDDAVTAYRAVLDRGADPAATILFGGSAGACLALATLLRIRDLGLPRPVGAVLLWPYVDFTFSGASIAENADIDMLPVRDLAPVWGPAYVGGADPRDPLVSPVFADLTGLPPLLILAGGAESLRSGAEQLAANARRDGVETQCTVYPGQVHGWLILAGIPASVAAAREIHEWMAARLDRRDDGAHGPSDPTPQAR